MGSVTASLRDWKHPEYTGENRCIACTIVNAVIGVVGSGLLAAGVAYATGAMSWAAGTGVAGLVASACLIYFRGYLIPGTPELTKRYFPPWLLSLFGKEPATPATPTEPREVDPEAALLAIGALEECQNGDDLCLRSDFRAAWSARMDELDREEMDYRGLVDVLDADEGASEFVEHGDAVQLKVDGMVRGTWESRAAVLADAGAADLLADRDGAWGDRTVNERSTLLSGLRLFLETCPECGGALSFGAETVESCCTTHEIYALECPDCSARLLESGPMG